MLTYKQMQEALDVIADGVPPEIYAKLNGGIVLSPETKVHPQSVGDELVINGEYHHEPNGLGRYIVLYYGSMSRSYGRLPDTAQIKKLKEVLYHELTHHLENLAGDKSLELTDAKNLEKYRQKHLQSDD